MPRPVRCDVCGKLLSTSTVKSHKRLAHAQAIVVVANDEDALPKIMRIYKTLSAEKKKEVLASLTSLDSDPS
jgi:DNA-directed RNA polymerase subunit N (RpoN/RPB10)